jgi:hypothetical protein
MSVNLGWGDAASSQAAPGSGAKPGNKAMEQRQSLKHKEKP